ncbi:MAG: hypothetical protein V1672_03535 [Candidatus Diapherotrites archaeon]
MPKPPEHKGRPERKLSTTERQRLQARVEREKKNLRELSVIIEARFHVSYHLRDIRLQIRDGMKAGDRIAIENWPILEPLFDDVETATKKFYDLVLTPEFCELDRHLENIQNPEDLRPYLKTRAQINAKLTTLQNTHEKLVIKLKNLHLFN